MPFNFRLRFHLPEDYRIQSTEREVELLGDAHGVPIKLRSGQRDQPINALPRASIIGGPFQTEVEAMDAGNRAKGALLLWAANQQVGVDLGGRTQRSVVTNAGLEMFRARFDAPVRNDFHGLDIYEPEPGLVFLTANVVAQVGKSADAFRNTFAEFFRSAPPPTEKQQLAFELFCGAFFDVSLRSRVVTLVSAIEALIESRPRSPNSHLLVDAMVALTTAADIGEDDRRSILGSLQWLRTDSIGQAGRALVTDLLGQREFGGKPARQCFTFCYDLRSQILHRGRTDDPSVDLGTVYGDLRQMVSELLQASVMRAAA